MEKQLQPQTIEEALEWHAAISQSVIQHRADVLAALRAGGTVPTAGSLVGKTESEIDEFFEAERTEVDAMCLVNIVAAAEVAIRRDYQKRVKRNTSDLLSKKYVLFKRSLRGRKVARPDFDEGGILDALKDSNAVAGHLITGFRHAMKIRHWYAHGRYWLLKSNAVEEPVEVHRICRALLDALPS